MRVLLATTATPDDRKIVGCVRALARSGAWVAVGGDAFWGQAFYSRSLRRRVRYPHPRLGISPFIEAINKHVERHHFDVVLPMNDYTTVALTRGRASLHPAVATALPEAASQEVARDKSQTMALAKSLGIETPRTFDVKDDDHLGEIGESIDFPCVLKPRRGSGAVGFQIIGNRQELSDAYQEPRGPSDIGFDREHLLVQEYVPGEVHDACVLYDHGKMRAALTQRRVRSHPPEGGIGSIVETTREPELLERARRLLDALHWHGPAMAEFKVDPETGRTWLIEINGRFWGSTDVATQAGIDFPLLTCELAVEGRVASSFDYFVGLRYRYPFPFGLLALRDGSSRWQAFQDFFSPQRGTHSDLMWSDPLPVIAESVLIARRAWQRRSLRPEKRRI